MPIQVNHIADLSLANHFKASDGNAPVGAQIKINKTSMTFRSPTAG